MLRVAVDGRALTPPVTGIGQSLKELLHRLGSQCSLTVHTPGLLPRIEPSLQASWSVGPRVKGNLYYHFLLNRAMARDRAQVLLAPLNILPGRCDIPAVLVVHDLTPLEHPGWHRWKNRITTLPFYESSFEKAKRIVCVSRETENILNHYFPRTRGRTMVIPHGFPVPPRETPQFDLPVPNDFMLFLSTLEPRKNLSMLLRARKLDPSLPPLLVAGAAGWKQKPPSGKGVYYLGPVTEEVKWDLLRRARLLVFPSLREGFGLPVWEALSCGTPVVSTPVPSVVEYPHTSVRVVDLSPVSLVEGIHEVLESESKPVDRDPFPSWEEVADRYLKVLTSAAHD